MAYPGYDGMWLPSDQDPRMGSQPTRGERECLVGYLEHYRQTLALKCDGLDAEQPATEGRAAVEHLAARSGTPHGAGRAPWFRRVIEAAHGAPSPLPGGGRRLRRRRRRRRPRVASHAAVAVARSPTPARSSSRTDLDAVVDVHGEPTEVRDIIVHMIEEYARHCGHADLVRRVPRRPHRALS